MSIEAVKPLPRDQLFVRWLRDGDDAIRADRIELETVTYVREAAHLFGERIWVYVELKLWNEWRWEGTCSERGPSRREHVRELYLDALHKVDLRNGDPHLRSPAKGNYWPRTEPLVSPPPSELGMDGIHAARDPGYALTYGGSHAAGFVLGRVKLWGKVIAGERGWRASKARPFELVLLPGREEVHRRCLEEHELLVRQLRELASDGGFMTPAQQDAWNAASRRIEELQNRMEPDRRAGNYAPPDVVRQLAADYGCEVVEMDSLPARDFVAGGMIQVRSVQVSQALKAMEVEQKRFAYAVAKAVAVLRKTLERKRPYDP
jgi:hypothetical protein